MFYSWKIHDPTSMLSLSLVLALVYVNVFNVFCQIFHCNVNRAYFSISVLYRQKIPNQPISICFRSSSKTLQQFFFKAINCLILKNLFYIIFFRQCEKQLFYFWTHSKSLCLISPAIVHSFYKIYFCLWCWTEKVTQLKCSYFISK